MIYLDNAATSLQKPKEVEEAVIRAFHTMGNPGRGAHEATLQAGRCVYQVREQLAELFHAEKGERIAFTSNATEALNTAILGLFHKGDHVITTVCEHNSVLRPLYRLQEEGVEVSFLSADENGVLEYEKLPELVRENTKGIVITHASNLTGNITDLERIREVTESRDLLLMVDGSQTAGILPVDVQKQGIDIFCFTGHKGLLGPQGTGGLYVRPGVEICPLKVGGSGIHSFDREHPKAMPEHLEAGTMNVHGIAGLGGALDYLKKKGTKEVLQRERQLLRRLEEQIREIPGIRLYGDPDGNRRVGILSFNIGEEESLCHTGIRRKKWIERQRLCGSCQEYENEKENMDFDFREYDAGDGSRKICHGTEPAGTSDPDSKGNYSRLWPFLEGSAGGKRRDSYGTGESRLSLGRGVYTGIVEKPERQLFGSFTSQDSDC